MRLKKLQFVLAATFTSLLAIPALAQDRGQSYVTYDDGDSVLVQNDGVTTDVRVNLPIFPGDELQTRRRGRTEVRMADGNIIAADRDTTLLFRSVLGSYEGDDSQTVVELNEGSVMVERLSKGGKALRLDTPSASYLASRNSVYGVEVETRGQDLVSVFEGSIEVRTREGSTRLRAGEQARIDEEGIYNTNELATDGTTGFERWFLRRADRYRDKTPRYVDLGLAYAESDLDAHGSWVYVSDYNSYVWRPRVAAGWRPYYYGYWRYASSGLVWVPDEPWGWVPFHYGRWAYSTLYGWVWLPGSGYGPAWVYWLYGPSYVGWIPSGWYDAYGPYYGWLYRDYYRSCLDFGFGFYGRVRVSTHGIHGWTFVDHGTLLSTRADRAALTTDAVRNRLTRDGGTGYISNNPLRIRGDERKDPGTVLGRLGRGDLGGGTGREGAGSPTDVTSFFQRDPALSNDIKGRITRSMPRDGAGNGNVPRNAGSDDRLGGRGTTESPKGGVVGGRGNGGSGGIAPRGSTSGSGSGDRPVPRGDRGDDSSGEKPRGGFIPRGNDGGSTESGTDKPRRSGSDRPSGGFVPRSRDTGENAPRENVKPRGSDPSDGDWRRGGGVVDRGSNRPADSDRPQPRVERDRPVRVPETRDSWRDQPVARPRESSDSGDRSRPRNDSPDADDTPSRVIGRIGGARITPSPSPPSGEVEREQPRRSGGTAVPRSERPSRSSSDTPRAERPSRSEGSSGRSSDSRGSSSSSKVDRSSDSGSKKSND